MKVTVSRKAHFNAAHRLYVKSWSDERNSKVFGKCSNPNFHGHNYEIIVNVKGSVDPVTGMVIDLKTLSNIIKSEILDKVDHKNLNLDVPFLKNKITSTENVILEFWKILEKKIKSLNISNCQLHSIRLYETPRNFVDYYGE